MKQLPLPVAQRRWLFNALFASGQIAAEITLGLLGSAAGWGLCASVPLAAVSWTGWWMNRTARRRQERPDYARIALLERELLGIEPELLGIEPESLTDRFADPELIRKPKRKKPPRPYPTRGGYMSSDRTINDLGPFPAAWTERAQET